MNVRTLLSSTAAGRMRTFAMAAADPQAQLAEHAALVRSMVGDVTGIKAEIDRLNEKLASLQAGPGGGANVTGQPDPMLKAFAAFARHGASHPRNFSDFLISEEGREVAAQLGVQAAMTTQSNPDGGYLEVPQLEKQILDVARDYSPLRTLATVQPISSGSYKILVDPSLMEAQWVSETGARPQTAGKKLNEITIPAEEIYANPHASQTLIEDSFVDIAGWFSAGVSNAFALKEGAAFAAGDGVGKPRGFLTYPTEAADDFARSSFATIQHVAAGSTTPSNDQLAAAIASLSMKLRAPYRAKAVWQMSRSTASTVRQLKDSTGLLLWATDGRFVDGVPEKLLGFPVKLNEDMPAIAANSYPIALGDFRGYTIVDRKGVNVLRDPYSNKPFVGFYTTKRVGGAVTDYNAVKLLKIAAS